MWVVNPTDAGSINWLVTLNSIHKNKNNPSEKEALSLMIKRQIPTNASNILAMYICEETVMLKEIY